MRPPSTRFGLSSCVYLQIKYVDAELLTFNKTVSAGEYA